MRGVWACTRGFLATSWSLWRGRRGRNQPNQSACCPGLPEPRRCTSLLLTRSLAFGRGLASASLAVPWAWCVQREIPSAHPKGLASLPAHQVRRQARWAPRALGKLVSQALPPHQQSPCSFAAYWRDNHQLNLQQWVARPATSVVFPAPHQVNTLPTDLFLTHQYGLSRACTVHVAQDATGLCSASGPGRRGCLIYSYQWFRVVIFFFLIFLVAFH